MSLRAHLYLSTVDGLSEGRAMDVKGDTSMGAWGRGGERLQSLHVTKTNKRKLSQHKTVFELVPSFAPVP